MRIGWRRVLSSFKPPILGRKGKSHSGAEWFELWLSKRGRTWLFFYFFRFLFFFFFWINWLNLREKWEKSSFISVVKKLVNFQISLSSPTHIIIKCFLKQITNWERCWKLLCNLIEKILDDSRLVDIFRTSSIQI